MQVWRVERWLRDHRATLAQFQEFLAREKAIPHPIEDSLDGRIIIPGRPFFLVYATGVELWSWPPRAASGSAKTIRRPRIWSQSAPNEPGNQCALLHPQPKGR